jgi:hypothetical protein
MRGAIGGYIQAASMGMGTVQSHLAEVFGDRFQTPQGWRDMLKNIPGGVDLSLHRSPMSWTRQRFQALYVACWIHHPVEKGSYMIRLSGVQLQNVKDAYKQLLKSGALQSRVSSHLSKKGASAHEGWDFLKGYEELLIQIEGETGHGPSLFLKCEGHALSGVTGTVMHLASWIQKNLTGSGMTASEALNDWAKYSRDVEGRAAENFSKGYKKLLKQLGLSGTMVTVEQAVEALLSKAGMPRLPGNVKGNTVELGHALLGPTRGLGYIEVFKRQRTVLKNNGVEFDDTAVKELTGIANRMIATSSPHEQQYYNEIHVTPADLDLSLANFRQYVPY